MIHASAELVKELRQLKSWTLRDLEKKLGGAIDYSGIGKREKSTKLLKADDRALFARAFGLTLDEFDERWKSRIAAAPPGIPVINRAPAGEILDYNHDHYAGGETHDAWQYIDRGLVGDADAYAVVVVGDSMEPNIWEGDLCVFVPLLEHKPSRQPVPGQVVFVRFTPDAPEEGCCLCRWSQVDDGKWLLSKDNRRYSPKIVDPEHVARMGLLVERRTKRV